MYAFYDDQELLSRVLTEKGVEHFHLIDVGAHDNIFYLPQFVPSLAYVTGHMYHTEDSAEDPERNCRRKCNRQTGSNIQCCSRR